MFYRKKRGNLKPDPSSIVLDLKPIMKARNILHPSAYLIKLGFSSHTVTKLLNDRAVQVNFRQLTKLCTNLNCTPNDILALRQMNLPPGHALHALHEIGTEDYDVTEWLKGKSIEEIRELMKK